MSVVVCIHKCIRNGYIESVNFIVHSRCLLLSEIISLITKFYLWNRCQYYISYMARTRKTSQ